MRQCFLILSLILISAASAFGQAAVPESFAGTWIANEKDPKSRRTLVISVSDNVMRIREDFVSYKRPYSNEATLFLDKRGEKNLFNVPGAESPYEVQSVTSIKKGKIVRKAEYLVVFRSGTEDSVTHVRTSDEYSLTKDGASLKVKSLTTQDVRRVGLGGPPGMPQPQPFERSGPYPFERTYRRQQ